ncbi:hypothetical protein BH11GEM2_BH11GEM2_01970 [soil metagenome]
MAIIFGRAVVPSRRARHVREVLAGRNYSPTERVVLIDELRKRVGATMRSNLVLVDANRRSARGKLRVVVNEVRWT